MYGPTGFNIIKEIAEQTIFSPSAQAKRDEQSSAGLLSSLLSKLRQPRPETRSREHCDGPMLHTPSPDYQP